MNNEKIKTNKMIMSIAMVFIAIFAFGTVFLTKENVSKLFADISSLKMKNNIVILNRNNTLSSIMTKTGELNLSILSDGIEISDSDLIKTNDVLRYNGTNYSIAVLADSNKDGIVDGADISRTYKIYRNIITNPTTVERMAADANEDNNVDGGDISRIYKIYRGIYIPGDDVNPDVDYTVTFDSNGGSEVSSITRHQNEVLGSLPEPTKDGCDFDGWYTNLDYQLRVSESTPVTGDITLYAKWSVNNYTVTFDSNGGSSVDSIVRHKGETVGELPTSTKEGFNLDGWYTEPDGGTKISSSTVVNGNITYYAHWGTDSYTITFNSKGGSAVAPITKSYNEEIGELPEPTKEGYTFIGWYKEETYETQVTSTTKVTASATYYAKWQSASIVLTFDTQVDDNVYYVSKDAGDTIGEFPEVERPGYSLEGWFTDTTYTTEVTTETIVIRDSTFYAKWGAEKFTIEFDSNGGIGGQTESVQASFDSPMPTISSVAPTKANYHFDGWYDSDNVKYYNADGTSARSYDKNEGTTLYAHWIGNDCIVTFVIEGDNTETINVEYGKKIGNLPEVTREGYEFEGWFTDETYSNEVTDDTVITENVTYYAKWSINEFTITLETNGGEIEGDDLDLTRQYNEMVGTLPEPTREGYTFAGWYEDEELETEISTSTLITGNVTYYAKWEIGTYVISFDSKGGTSVSSITRTYHQAIGELPETAREGYTFIGWYTDSSYTTVVTSETLAEGNAIYCAKWIANSYTISFDLNGGTGGPSNSVTASYGNILPDLSNSIPTKEGYTFLGWFDSNNKKYYSKTGQSLSNYDKTENTTLYAHWRDNSITAYKCRRATEEELHPNVIESGYYGQVGTTGQLHSGDAFMCDVNESGIFDRLFYYVSDYYDTSTQTFNNDYATLIYSRNWPGNTNNIEFSGGAPISGPDKAKTLLPGSTQWSNVSLYKETRSILGEYKTTHNATSHSINGNTATYPTNFSYSGYAARFLTAQELMSACGITEVGNYNTNEFNNCKFISEGLMTSPGQSAMGYWIETAATLPNEFKDYIVQGSYVTSGSYGYVSDRSWNSTYGVRPVIDVKKTDIDF